MPKTLKNIKLLRNQMKPHQLCKALCKAVLKAKKGPLQLRRKGLVKR